MAVKTNKGYLCGYCKKFFTDPIDADNCKETHNLIYVALSNEDLQRLITFIYTREEAVLTETLVENLKKYSRSAFDMNLIKKEHRNQWPVE